MRRVILNHKPVSEGYAVAQIGAERFASILNDAVARYTKDPFEYLEYYLGVAGVLHISFD